MLSRVLSRRCSDGVIVGVGLLCAGFLSNAAPALAAAPEKPVTEAAEEVTATTATLHGELNPLVEAMTGYDFAYNTNGTCEPGTTTIVEPEAKVKALKVSTPVTGLEPNKAYTFCVVATHLEGATTESTRGAVVPFKTLGVPPTVDTESTSGVTSTAASLEAQVNPNNQETTYAFEYAAEEALIGTPGATTITGAPPALTAGFGDQPASVATGAALTPGKTYFYRVVATNATGSTTGPTQSFAALPVLPLLSTGGAQSVTATTATLSGTVNPGGAETTYHYAYIDGAGYRAALEESAANPYAEGSSTPEYIVGSDYTVHATDKLEVSELTPETVYHYAVVATNSLGTTIGPDQTFTTTPAPVVAPVRVEASTAPVPGTLPTLITTSPDLTGVLPIPAAREPARSGERTKKKHHHRKPKKKRKSRQKGKKASRTTKAHNTAKGRH